MEMKIYKPAHSSNNLFIFLQTLKFVDLSKSSRTEKVKFLEDALKTVRPSEFSKDEIVKLVPYFSDVT